MNKDFCYTMYDLVCMFIGINTFDWFTIRGSAGKGISLQCTIPRSVEDLEHVHNALNAHGGYLVSSGSRWL